MLHQSCCISSLPFLKGSSSFFRVVFGFPKKEDSDIFCNPGKPAQICFASVMISLQKQIKYLRLDLYEWLIRDVLLFFFLNLSFFGEKTPSCLRCLYVSSKSWNVSCTLKTWRPSCARPQKKTGVLERHFEIGHGDMKVTWCTPQVQDDSQGQHLDSY